MIPIQYGMEILGNLAGIYMSIIIMVNLVDSIEDIRIH